MESLTANMNVEQIIELAKTRPEIPWHWGCMLNRQEAIKFASDNELKLEWDKPIRPGDLYIAKRNTGYDLLTCKFLGEACVFPTSNHYAYDFSETVLVVE